MLFQVILSLKYFISHLTNLKIHVKVDEKFKFLKIPNFYSITHLNSMCTKSSLRLTCIFMFVWGWGRSYKEFIQSKYLTEYSHDKNNTITYELISVIMEQLVSTYPILLHNFIAIRNIFAISNKSVAIQSCFCCCFP